ncbi:MAG TPA: M1 family aminopeptidase [Thermoleophilaceae bacterium]|nr:M1 family aminopeptidase [Thermoleophilaceae bacterium]
MRAALAVLLSLALAPAAAARPVEIRGADPEAYTLDLRYEHRGAGFLTGSERIEFLNRGPGELNRVWLRLWANGPDDCRPRRIQVEVEAPATAGVERVRCSALEVRLAAPVPPGGSGSISLRFEVRARRVADRFGRVRGTVLLGNVIPVLAVRDRRGLHLEPYAKRGESFYSLGARWDAVLRLPRRLRAATTGATVSETVAGGVRTLRVSTAQARDFSLALGRLRLVQASQDGVRVRVFAGARVRGSRGSLRVARRALRLLGRRLGPYDSTELDVVLVRGGLGAGIGMEYPELVFSIPAADVITHEVAHQWWYGLVGNNQYREPWLDESFAQYSHERLHPRTNFCLPRNPYLLVAPWRRHIPLDSSMRLFERAAPDAVGEVVYFAGSCALQRLERDIGRARMTALLRLLQTRHRHGVMTRSDVLAAIRQAAPRYGLTRWLRIAHLAR